MERYIEQLIDDIHKATWNIRPPHEIWEKSGADPDDELELQDISFVEEFVYGKKEKISKITGIKAKMLPLGEKLTSAQQAQLASELENLLQFFHFILDFPENYPTELRYAFIRKIWKKKYIPISFGEKHIELCSFNEEKCPFPGYCTICKEIATELKCDEGIGDSDFDPPVDELIDFEMINGFYDDDGNKIDPNSVPVPGLCIICKQYQSDDSEENLLCLMNRNDQRNERDFKCGAYEKL